MYYLYVSVSLNLFPSPQLDRKDTEQLLARKFAASLTVHVHVGYSCQAATLSYSCQAATLSYSLVSLRVCMNFLNCVIADKVLMSAPVSWCGLVPINSYRM